MSELLYYFVLGRQPGLAQLAAYADPDFRAEAYLPAGGPPLSVAAAAGLS